MLGKFVKVIYSIKNIILISLLIVIFIMIGVFDVFFVQHIYIIKIGIVIFYVFYIVLFIYLALNRIKEITISNGEVLIKRFLLGNLSFEGRDIKFISKDALKIGKKTFNLKYVVNKNELILILLNAMEIKNIDEAMNGVLSGVHLYRNKEDINKVAKKTNISLIILIALMGIGFTATIILNHWSIIFIICTVILIVFWYLKDIIFEKSINNVNSKFLKLILKGITTLICIALTIAIGTAIYRIFKIWNIDLLKIKL